VAWVVVNGSRSWSTKSVIAIANTASLKNANPVDRPNALDRPLLPVTHPQIRSPGRYSQHVRLNRLVPRSKATQRLRGIACGQTPEHLTEVTKKATAGAMALSFVAGTGFEPVTSGL
jgi:hypothetical protein